MAATAGSFRLGPEAGRVVIKTTRAGLAAKAGHDLTIEVTRWSARVEVPAEDGGGLAAATVQADLDLGSLEVREGTGGALPLTDRDRREIKKQIGSILGSVQGLIAGYVRGTVGGAIMAFTDAMLAFPTLLLALAVMATLGPVPGERDADPDRVRDQAVFRLLRRAQAPRRGRGRVRGRPVQG